MARILVTGGAGFVGSALVRCAVAAGHQVFNIDKLTYAGRLETLASVQGSPSYRFLRADVGDAPQIAAAMADFAPEAVFHLAAESHVDRSIDDPAAFLETNVRGSYVMLECALRFWSQLDDDRRQAFRFVHVSTDEVYGSLAGEGAFREDSPYRPNSPYAASKAAADHLARAWCVTYRLPVVVSNCGNNYGPFQHPEKLIPTIIRHALGGEPIPVYGDGRNCREWLHVEDHVEGLLCLLHHGRCGESYLFGGAGPLANIDLVRRVCAVLDRQRPRPDGGSHADRIAFVPDRPGHDFRYAIDSSKARRELGWHPTRTLSSHLPEVVAWYLAHPAWMVRERDELGRLGINRRSGSG